MTTHDKCPKCDRYLNCICGYEFAGSSIAKCDCRPNKFFGVYIKDGYYYHICDHCERKKCLGAGC